MAVSASPPSVRFPGLSGVQVDESRRRHGPNELTPPRREPWWRLWLAKFEDPVIRILIIAALAAIGVGVFEGQYAEGLGIILAILLATTLAFLNEFRANREFDLLNRVSDDVPVKVVRDGLFRTIPRREVVVGDVVFIELGEEAPADGAVLEAVNLQLDESRLTGESAAVSKTPTAALAALPASEGAYPADLVLRGTMVADGHGFIEIRAVGDATEIGKTARAAAEERTEETPLNRQLEKLSKIIGVVGLHVAAFVFVALLLRGASTGELTLSGPQWVFVAILFLGTGVALVRVWLPIVYDALEIAGWRPRRPAWLENDSLMGWVATFAAGALVFALGLGLTYLAGLVPGDPAAWLPYEASRELLHYFMIAVTVIVVAVPEGLAMSVTLSLAYSMRRMTAENNLVRRMHACETIGATTVICSDKTGTLTLNEMRVGATELPVLGQAGLCAESAAVIVEAIAVNSTANLGREEGVAKALGNPTEGALLLWLDQQAVDYVPVRSTFAVEYQWTFSTERKYMATLGVTPRDGRRVLHVKGAPELLLSRSSARLGPAGVAPLSAEERLAQEQALLSYQRRGMRTLALAYRDIPAGAHVELEDAAADLIWLGFVAIADPVRPEVPAAIAACRGAGVAVKLVTGDSPDTALEIARQIGLWDASDGQDRHVSGREFQQMSDDQARAAALALKVMSRARPMDKLRLVQLLQQADQVVAVTGDGTNDAPALNHANVGLAMGKTGTAVAKEASDIILLDDSFRSILNAVMWGRSLYENIQRFVVFQLTINVAALGIALLGPFLGVKFPLTVTQMLWVNLIMDTFAALALATEPARRAVLLRPPRRPSDFIVSPHMARIIFGAAAAFLLVLLALLVAIGSDETVTTRELTLFFCVFVLLQFWNLFNARTVGQRASAFSGILRNRSFLIITVAILVGQILLVQFGGAVFRTTPLSFLDWLVVIVATSPVLWVGEVWRWLKRRGAEEAGPTLTPAPW
ncbi:MAG: calcium-translocating P-type ATPase, PMCA-type [Gemmataceae bacterium]